MEKRKQMEKCSKPEKSPKPENSPKPEILWLQSRTERGQQTNTKDHDAAKQKNGRTEKGEDSPEGTEQRQPLEKRTGLTAEEATGILQAVGEGDDSEHKKKRGVSGPAAWNS